MKSLLYFIDHCFDAVTEKLANHVITGSGCWEYQGPRKQDGYGRIRICLPGDKRDFQAHRVSYAYYSGVDPGFFHVCHKCDNPACINPGHLFLGTARDNTQDMHQKGRAAPMTGEHNPGCKLSEEMVLSIVAEIKKGKSNKAIASTLPVTHSQVSLIRLGKSWKPLLESINYDPSAYRRRAA